jgi:membrane fusion protein, multidrug efflux system
MRVINIPMSWCMPLALLLATITLGCDGKPGASSAGQTAAAPRLQAVVVDELIPRTVPIFTDFVAQTYSDTMVEIRARVDGFIEQKAFNTGDVVREGAVLYVLDRRPYEAAVRKASADVADREAGLAFARQQVELTEAEAELAQANAEHVRRRMDVGRFERLVPQGYVARQDLENAVQFEETTAAVVRAKQANVEQKRLTTRQRIDSAEAALEAARALLADAELSLGYATIRAPITGRVGDTGVQVGGLVTKNSSTPLTTIIPLDPISARFKISEAEYLAYTRQHGQALSASPIQLVLADNTVYAHAGRIKRVLNQLDARTGTLELQADFPNPQGMLRSGQFGRIRYQADEKRNALLVPQAAVQELQGARSVLTVGADNKVVARNVVAGERVGDHWIIDQGLKPGDRVIVEGLQKVQPGMTVAPQRAPGR